MESDLSAPEGRLNLKCLDWLRAQHADGLLVLPPGLVKQDLLITRLASLLKLAIEEHHTTR